MTAATIIRTLIEVIAVLLVAYAIYHEDKVSAFEAKLSRAIKYYHHRYTRKKAQEAVMKNRAFKLAVDNSCRSKPADTSGKAVC